MTTYTAHTGRTIRTRHAWGTVHRVVERYAETDDWTAIVAGTGVPAPTARRWVSDLGLRRSRAEARRRSHAARRDLDYAAMEAEAVRIRRETGDRTGLVAEKLEQLFGVRLPGKTLNRWFASAGLMHDGRHLRRVRAETGRLGAEARWGAIPSKWARYRRSTRRRGLRKERKREADRTAFVWTEQMREEALAAIAAALRNFPRLDPADDFMGVCWLFLEHNAHTYRGGQTWTDWCFHTSFYAVRAHVKRESRAQEVEGYINAEGVPLTLLNHFDPADTLAIYAQAEST